MTLKVHFYQLPANPDFPRIHSGKGALLALEDESHLTGYSDLHPWTTLGDLDLDQQLQKLQQNNPTLQTQLSLNYAKRDLQSKQTQTKSIHFLKNIKNHHLILKTLRTSQDLEDYFLTAQAQFYNASNASLSPSFSNLETPENILAIPLRLKMKLTTDTISQTLSLINETSRLYPNVLWRLDANSIFNFKEVLNLWNQLSTEAKNKIDLIEDPCPYSQQSWKKLEDEGIPLAIDFEINRWKTTMDLNPSPTPSKKTTFVLKPAIHDMEEWKIFLKNNPHPFFITSYLDHPVGLLHALWTAESFQDIFPQQMQTCGLNFSFSNPQLKKFWPGLTLEDLNTSYWRGEPSIGIGFSHLLQDLSWQTLGTL